MIDIEKTRSAPEWLSETQHFAGITILDPDGWDRANFEESWNERITLDEMRRRVSMSSQMVYQAEGEAP